LQIALTKKLADALGVKLPAADDTINPLFTWTADWTIVWNNRRTEDILVLVNNATRFTVAIYQVKRKDLKNIEKMMKAAIVNTLLSMNLNPELVNEYMRLAGELEFVQNNSRQTAAWVSKAGLECAFHVGREYNGIAKMFSDTVGALANYRIVNYSGNADVRLGFKSCKKYNVCLENGTYPAAMMVKELKPGALDGRKWVYYDSPVMKIDEQEAGRFDESLEKMEKKLQPSQEEFYIHSHSIIP
jgi:hypothetical protein